MSERLEGIKDRYMKHEYDYALSSMDIDWLIQQTERVEELENLLKHRTKMLKYSRDRNMRYKQALEGLRKYAMDSSVERDEDGSPLPDPDMDFLYHTTTEALEKAE